jgi:hypothetical protein
MPLGGCKVTNPKTTRLKSAEETQGEIKSEITDLLLNPAKLLLVLLEPIASQFKSVQNIKAAADGAITRADAWARRELELARQKHRENIMLWDLAKLIAGPDGLLNYQDIKNTLACTQDAELKSAIQFILDKESKNSSLYTKDAILIISKHIQNNTPLPTYRKNFSPLAFLSANKRPDEIKNEIHRQLARTFQEQCAIPKDQIHQIGAFDLIKTYCSQALEWRSQGIFAGVLNLPYEPRSIDKPGSCKNRELTKNFIAELYTKYIAASTQKIKEKTSIAGEFAHDFVRIQISKYFGPLETNAQSIQFFDPEQDYFLNYYVKFPPEAQITLRGGVPVVLLKQLMDDFSDGKNNLLLGDLGRISRAFNTTTKCKALVTKFIPRKISTPQALGDVYYKDLDEFKAYFDPKFDEEKYFKERISNRNQLRDTLGESRTNKSNAVLKQFDIDNVPTFFHQSMHNIEFWGSIGSSLTRSQFTKIEGGRIRMDYLYLENIAEGQFSVHFQRRNSSGKFELQEYDGYAVPYTVNNPTLMTPCVEFSALN